MNITVVKVSKATLQISDLIIITIEEHLYELLYLGRNSFLHKYSLIRLFPDFRVYSVRKVMW